MISLFLVLFVFVLFGYVAGFWLAVAFLVAHALLGSFARAIVRAALHEEGRGPR